ncbi:MAG: hypothetical protein QOF21_1636 [Actinomycetota bacterium]|jgi:nitroimidazol reductase NimA-like FMN-containing flavoprotein (pyridoxamine 5'-phosphate oxidase superfamily)
MDAARNEPELLARRECLRLLGHSNVGRLALSSGALPMIVAVNYRVAHDVLLVRTPATERLKAATDGTVVAFEASGVETDDNAAWSVSIAGVAREATADELATADEQDPVDVATLPDWVAPHAERVIAISIEHVTGRRVALPLVRHSTS